MLYKNVFGNLKIGMKRKKMPKTVQEELRKLKTELMEIQKDLEK